MLAQRIEQTFTKDQILELYLNEIFLGFGSYGVAAASLNYFGKSLNDLALAEMAYLAALPKAPNNYHPFRQPERAIERRNWVLDQMVENGYVTAAEERRRPWRKPLVVNPRPRRRRSLRRRLLCRGGAPRADRASMARTSSTRAGCRCAPRSTRACRSWRGRRWPRPHQLRPQPWLARRRWPRSTLAGDWGKALGAMPRARRRHSVAAGGGPRRSIGAESACRSAPARHAIGAARSRWRLLKWARKPATRRQARSARSRRPPMCWTPGDVVYVDAGDRGRTALPLCARCPRSTARSSPWIPHTGRVLAHGRRLLLWPEPVQPRRPGAAPAGLVVQAVRLCGGARQWLHAVLGGDGRADRDQRCRNGEIWKPENYTNEILRPLDAAARHRAVAQRHDRPAGAGSRHATDRRLARAVRHLRPYASRCWPCRSAPARPRCSR